MQSGGLIFNIRIPYSKKTCIVASHFLHLNPLCDIIFAFSFTYYSIYKPKYVYYTILFYILHILTLIMHTEGMIFNIRCLIAKIGASTDHMYHNNPVKGFL